MDGVYSSWATRVPDGFSDDQIATLQRIAPYLALAIKSVSLARMTGTLMETYLGRDAGQRVLSGRIVRGIAERIDAVVWFSDLRGFTRITDTAPEQVIPLLNDYCDAIVSAIHEHGGDVLKLIGDGTLAIFTAEDRTHACGAALSAAIAARERVDELNRRRVADGKPITDMYLGLHVGEVFYGNVGSRERLDFTVIGPAVNEASRIAAITVCVCFAFASEPSWAQHASPGAHPVPSRPSSAPPSAGPADAKVEFENESIVVMRVRMAPHEKTPMHDIASARLVVWLTDAHLRDTHPDGSANETHRRAGAIDWVDVQRHAGENLSHEPLEFLAIVPKAGGAAVPR